MYQKNTQKAVKLLVSIADDLCRACDSISYYLNHNFIKKKSEKEIIICWIYAAYISFCKDVFHYTLQCV